MADATTPIYAAPMVFSRFGGIVEKDESRCSCHKRRKVSGVVGKTGHFYIGCLILSWLRLVTPRDICQSYTRFRPRSMRQWCKRIQGSKFPKISVERRSRMAVAMHF